MDHPLVRQSTYRTPPARGRRPSAIQRDGLDAVTRVKAAAYVAHVGMALAAQLSAEEEMLIRQHPLAEPRMKGIVDQFALMASWEVIGLGH